MFAIPSPLHPALVHFPIVLILAGTAVAVVAVFLRKWHLPWLAAGFLAAGAAGAVAAAWSGEEDGEMAGEMAGEISARAEQVLDEHEEWGERTRNLAILSALLAVGAVVAVRSPGISRGIGVAAAVAGLAASYAVAQAGHYGGLLVYKNGVGVNAAAGEAPAAAQPRDRD